MLNPMDLDDHFIIPVGFVLSLRCVYVCVDHVLTVCGRVCMHVRECIHACMLVNL